jgi:hypothetical protein
MQAPGVLVRHGNRSGNLAAQAHRRVAAHAVLEPAAASPARRSRLAAMHAADALAAHRRLAAGPMVVLAAGLAARREPQVAPVEASAALIKSACAWIQTPARSKR